LVDIAADPEAMRRYGMDFVWWDGYAGARPVTMPMAVCVEMNWATNGFAVLTLKDGTFSVNAGLLWLLAAAVGLSVYNLLQRHLTKTYTGMQTAAFSIYAGTLMLAMFAPQAARELVQAPPIQYCYLAVLGIGSSAVAYVAWTMAFARAKQTSQVSNYMFVTPFLASLFGFLLAGEVPDRATLVGGSIILVGLLLFNFGGALGRRFVIQKN
jgi:drug/metabolite transporter (DMT)-like permease